MPALEAAAQTRASYESDSELARLAGERRPDAIAAIIRRNNQRLYRLARAVVRDDADAEDVLQEAYLRAFASIGSFRGDATLATWLSRIVINEALGRLRRRRRHARTASELATVSQAEVIPFPLGSTAVDPEKSMAQRQLLQMAEQASDNLPEVYRIVFMARVVEGLSVEDTADVLGLKPATVKTRLHRARTLVRQELEAQIGPLLMDAFPFAGKRCDRLTSTVLARLGLNQ